MPIPTETETESAILTRIEAERKQLQSASLSPAHDRRAILALLDAVLPLLRERISKPRPHLEEIAEELREKARR